MQRRYNSNPRKNSSSSSGGIKYSTEADSSSMSESPKYSACSQRQRLVEKSCTKDGSCDKPNFNTKNTGTSNINSETHKTRNKGLLKNDFFKSLYPDASSDSSSSENATDDENSSISDDEKELVNLLASLPVQTEGNSESSADDGKSSVGQFGTDLSTSNNCRVTKTNGYFDSEDIFSQSDDEIADVNPAAEADSNSLRYKARNFVRNYNVDYLGECESSSDSYESIIEEVSTYKAPVAASSSGTKDFFPDENVDFMETIRLSKPQKMPSRVHKRKKCTKSGGNLPLHVELQNVIDKIKLTSPKKVSTVSTVSTTQTAPANVNTSKECTPNAKNLTEPKEVQTSDENTYVCVYSSSKKFAKPYQHDNEIPFIRGMPKSIAKEISPLERHAWPNVLFDNPMVIISEPTRARAMSYLPALCHKVYSKMAAECANQPTGRGPICIVVTSTREEAELVNEICLQMMPAQVQQRHTTLFFTPCDDNTNFLTIMMSGCGILVCQLSDLIWATTTYKSCELLCGQRLNYIVYESAHIILKRHMNELPILLTEFNAVGAGCKQVIYSSEYWLRDSYDRLRNIPDIVFVTDEPLTVAYIINAKFEFQFVEDKQKQLLTYLKQNFNPDNQDRVVIFCSDNVESSQVQTILEKNGFFTFKLNCSPISAQIWDTSKIFLCTDHDFDPLKYPRDINMLINYSIPQTMKTFNRRFLFFERHCENLFTCNKAPTKQNRTLMLFDKDIRSAMLHRYLEFAKKCHIQLDEQEHNKLLCLREEYEFKLAKLGTPLCKNFLSLKSCDYSICNYRHQPTDVDVPTSNSPYLLKPGDVIKIKILQIINVTHYSVRIVQQRHADTASTLIVNIAKFYAQISNRIPFGIPKIGDICIIADKGTYARARVISVSSDVAFKDAVSAQLIDISTSVLTRPVHDLYKCHEQFRNLPDMAINVRLIGFVPPNDNKLYTSMHKLTTELFSQVDCDFMVNVQFSIEGTIFASDIFATKFLSNINRPIVKFNINAKLASKIHKECDSKDIKDFCDKFAVVIEATTRRAMSTLSEQALQKEQQSKTDETSNTVEKIAISNENSTNEVEDKPVKPLDQMPTEIVSTGAAATAAELLQTDLQRKRLCELESALKSCLEDPNEQENVMQFLGYENAAHTDLVNDERIAESNRPTKRLANGTIKLANNDSVASQDAANKTLLTLTNTRYAHPNVKWHQTKDYVCFKIAATEQTEYELTYCDHNLIYRTLNIEPMELFYVHLISCVQHQIVRHEKRGLSVVVKVHKELGDWELRLPKLPWLKYNMDAEPCDPFENCNEAEYWLTSAYDLKETAIRKYMTETDEDDDDNDCDDSEHSKHF